MLLKHEVVDGLDQFHQGFTPRLMVRQYHHDVFHVRAGDNAAVGVKLPPGAGLAEYFGIRLISCMDKAGTFSQNSDGIQFPPDSISRE